MAGIGAIIATVWAGIGFTLGQKFIRQEKVQKDV
jgi:hypothetical protein